MQYGPYFGKGFCAAPHVGIEQYVFLDQFSSGQRPPEEKMIFQENLCKTQPGIRWISASRH
jgi:hypothetical protein